MNGLWTVACEAGLQDALNPFVFMTCAVFIALGFWFNSGALRITAIRILFSLVYIASFLEFNFGSAQVLVLQKGFVFGAKLIYLLLGIWTFTLGVLCIKDWVLLHRGLVLKDLIDKKLVPFAKNGLTACLLTGILAVICSALASIGPINKYIVLLGNEEFLKGQWKIAMLMLVWYVFFSMWPAWLLWVFLSLKNLRLSLLKIVCAAVFFTASSCVILIFTN